MQIRIIASSTMVQHSIRCMICGRPVDHRVVFLTNDARVLHAGCVPDHVKVPSAVLLQAIRRLERMVERARAGSSHQPGDPEPASVGDLDSHDRAGSHGDPGSLPGPNGHGGPGPVRPGPQGREAEQTGPGPGGPGT